MLRFVPALAVIVVGGVSVVTCAAVSTTGTEAAARACPSAGVLVSIDASFPPDSKARALVLRFVPALTVSVPLTGNGFAALMFVSEPSALMIHTAPKG